MLEGSRVKIIIRKIYSFLSYIKGSKAPIFVFYESCFNGQGSTWLDDPRAKFSVVAPST